MFTQFFPRLKSLSLIVVAALAVASLGRQEARAQNNLGDVVITADLKNTPILVTGSTAEINTLANNAFNAHGAFRRQAQGYAYKVDFAPAGPNQVQVTVTRSSGVVSVERAGGASASTARGPGTPVLSQVVSGNSGRNALLKAADLAVKAMTGKPGFFASRLAFIGERTGKPEVHVGDLFFGEVRAITSDKALALTPRWAPDGQRLLYTSFYRTGYPDIFLMDLGSLQRSTFVSLKGTNSGARFSPNGKNVALVLTGEGNPEIYVSNEQGRQITRKTRTTAIESSPCFSPDGSKIVFTSDAAGGPQLYIMPAAGGAAQRLPTRISGYCAEPDWSKAQPNKIVFTVRSGKGYQLAVYDLAGGIARLVSKQTADAVEPSWLADGRHVVFTSRSAGASGIWILDTENGKATQLSGAAIGKVSQPSVLDPR